MAAKPADNVVIYLLICCKGRECMALYVWHILLYRWINKLICYFTMHFLVYISIYIQVSFSLSSYFSALLFSDSIKTENLTCYQCARKSNVECGEADLLPCSPVYDRCVTHITKDSKYCSHGKANSKRFFFASRKWRFHDKKRMRSSSLRFQRRNGR